MGKRSGGVVPFHEQLAVLAIRQQGQLNDRLVGVGYDRGQQGLQVSYHTLDSRRVEQSSIVFKETLQRFRALIQGEQEKYIGFLPWNIERF